MWKKVIALNLAIVLTLALLPIQAIAGSDIGYAVFHKNDGSNETVSVERTAFTSNGCLELYINMPKYVAEDKRVVSFNSMSDGSGINYQLTDPIREVYSTDASNPANLYAMWEGTKDNSILYLCADGATEDGKDYYLQSDLSQSATVLDGNIFAVNGEKAIVGWKSLNSSDIYLFGEEVEITSNMTLLAILGLNYFRFYYKDYAGTMCYKNMIIDWENDYLDYSKKLSSYAKDVTGEIFVGWNSEEDGSGEWITELNEDTPHNLYAQYEPCPEDDTWVKISSDKGLEDNRMHAILHANESNQITLPSFVSNGTKVAYWQGDYSTYPAGEQVPVRRMKEQLWAVTIDEGHQLGLVYGNGGKTEQYHSEYVGINYFMTSSGRMSLYSFDQLKRFRKEGNVLVGYKGDKTGNIYDYYGDIETALSNEKDGDISRFTAQFEPIEKGYIQYLGNGGFTADDKGQYYEEIDFSDVTTETYAENKFIHPDGELFLGWSTSNEKPTAIYLPEEKVDFTENTILYAQWGDNAVITHGIHYFYGEEVTQFYRNVDKISSLSYEDSYYNRKGYYFKGWNTKPDGSGEWYVCDDVVADGKALDLYEQWEKAPSDRYYYAISKVKQPDGSQLKLVSMEEEKAVITIPEGLGVKYWKSSETAGSIPWYGFADETEYIYSPGDEVEVSSGTVISPFEPWTILEYNENFGEENNTRIQYHMVSHASLKIYSPEEVFSNITDDRVFVEWNDSPDGTGKSYPVNGYFCNASKTLYAQWYTSSSIISGTCGDNITWELTGDGTLMISGTGAMDNNSSWDEDRFWNDLKPHIKSVVVEEGITYIGNYAFYECANLENVTIPKSVTEIGYDAFYGCNKIKSVNISDIEAWCSIDFGWDREANPLSKCSELYLNGVLTTNITIPSTVKSISNYAFYNCKWLEGISFEGDLSGVSWSTFDGCTNLKSIGVSNLEIWIKGAYYFEDCLMNNPWDLYVNGKLLEDLVIPESITWMNSNKTFYNCKSIKSVTFHDEFYNIPENAFANCVNLSDINLSANINGIGENAFYNTAFYNDQSNWSNGTLCIGNHLIKVKESVSGEFTIPAKTTQIAAGAFEGTGVTKVYIHANVNNMQGAFADATNLTTVEIASGATYIPYRAFYNCSNLSEIIIPDSVYQIEQDAFTNTAFYNDDNNWENESLYLGKFLVAHKGEGTGEYVVKDGTKVLASGIFQDSGYSKIVLPDSIEIIGSQAFYNCTNLTEMTLPGGIEQLQWGLFYGCTSLKTVTLPDDVTGMSNQVFTDCTALETVYNMPVKLNWIGTPIFTNCISLKDIYSEGTSAQWAVQYGGCDLGIDLSTVTVHCEGDNRPADSCGKTLTWSLSEDGVLTISGTGKMYDFEDGTAPWYSDREKVKEVIIGNGVTKVGAHSFNKCPNLKVVRIAASVETMGENAFNDDDRVNRIDSVYIDDLKKWCTIKYINSRANPIWGGVKALYLNDQLVENLVLPEEITEISDFAFCGYSGLKSVFINKNITNEYRHWFSGCYNLEQITVDPDNPAYLSENGILFNKDKSVLYQCIQAFKNTHYTIPSTVVKIWNEAFSNCRYLQSITLPEGLREIDYYMFNYCVSLREVTIPKTVTTIRRGAFRNCSALTTVNYSGANSGWNQIAIEQENNSLLNATIRFGKAEVSLSTINGAQIRTNGAQGLRFISTIDKTSLDFDRVVEYGTVLIPSADITDISELEIGATLNGHTVAKVQANNLYEVTDESITFTAVITDIAEKNYAREYTARAYAILDDGTVVYADAGASRSIYAVAKRGLENPNESDENKAVFQGIVDIVEG